MEKENTKQICICCHQVIKVKQPTYNEAVKRAIYKYREKNVDSNKINSMKSYNKKKDDPEWRLKYNERCKINNAKYYRLKKLSQKENETEIIKEIN